MANALLTRITPAMAARAAILLVPTLAAHGVAMPGAFVWDDVTQIPQNPRLRSLDGLASIWTSTQQPDYWPLAYSTYWLQWQLFGDWAPGYRAVSLAMHFVNALLVWAALARLRVPAAWFCAVTFAVHPVTVEATAWILQQKTLLSTLLALACLTAFLDHLAAPTPRRLLAALVAHVAALLTKSSVVTWPAVLVLAAWWQRRGLRRDDVRLTLPFWYASLALGLVGVWFQRYRAIGDEVVRDDGLLSRLAIAGRAVWFYARQAVWPADLCFVYPRWQLGTLTAVDFVPLAALGLVFIAAWSTRATWGRPIFGSLAYYLLALLPALGLVNIYFMRYSLVADHWQYLALPGLLALVCGAVAASLDRVAPFPLVLKSAAGIAVVVALVVACSRQAARFAGPDNERLWLHTLQHNPSAGVAHSNLGGIYFARGDLVAARRHHEAARRLDPYSAEAEAALATIALSDGRLADALRGFRRVLKLQPGNLYARAGVHLVSGVEGDWRAALAQLNPAMRAPRQQAQWLLALGRCFLATNRPDDAVEALQSARQLNPDDPQIDITLAAARRQASG